MKVMVTVEDTPQTVRLEREGDRFRFASGDLPLQETSVIEVEPGIYSVLWNGQSFEAKVTLQNGSGFVDIKGRHYAVAVSDPRELGSGGAGATQGREEVTAPMPGKVVRVLVEEGAEVEAGQGIVVVEAMKMQNEMPSPKRGRVVALRAREGATVTAGELLATIE
jgi:biotin carboxyl carrier protein